MIEFTAMLLAYVVGGTVIALVSRRFGVKSTKEYFVADYRLRGFLASMTYAATTYSAFMMVGLVGLTYATGIGALGFELAYLVATLTLLAVFTRRVLVMARERGWVSPSEMLSDLYGSRLLGSLVAAVYLIALVPYTSAQLIGIGTVFEGLGLGYVAGVSVGAVLLVLWIVIAGVWSVATTDAYQGLWMIAASVILLAWLLYLVPAHGYGFGDVIAVLDRVGATGITPFWSLPVFLSYTLPWVFFAVTNPQVVQRLYMPVNERAAKVMVKYFSAYGLLYTVIVVVVGMIARSLTEFGIIPRVAHRDLVTPTLLNLLNPIVSSFIYVSIVAAALSTANSIVLSVTSSVVRDFYETRARSVSSRAALLFSNAVVVVLTLMAAAVAYVRPAFIVEMSVITSVILLPLAPTTIAAWVSPSRTRMLWKYAVISVVAGTSIAMYAAVAYGPARSFVATIYGLPISAWVLAVSTVIVAVGCLLHRTKPSPVTALGGRLR